MRALERFFESALFFCECVSTALRVVIRRHERMKVEERAAKEAKERADELFRMNRIVEEA